MYKSIRQAISDVIEPARHGDGVNTFEGGRTLYTSVSPEDQEKLGIEAAVKHISDATKKVTAKAHDAMAAAMPDLFDGIDGMMNVGAGNMKPTMMLNKTETEWVITVRDKQLIDDTKKLRKLRQLYVRALPAWDNPDRALGDCLKAVSTITAEIKVAA